MIEKYFGELNIGSEKTIEEMKGELAVPEKEETPEQKEWRELKERYAAELRTPEQGSYKKRLAKIAAALAVAGITILGSGEKATAPEVYPERVVADMVGEVDVMKDVEVSISELPGGKDQNTLEAYKSAIGSIIEMGGVEESPQLPGRVYKNMSFAKLTRGFAEVADPYNKKPEVIFGEKFVRENPQETKEYMGKILEGMGASVKIETSKGWGSAVIINTDKKGKVFLTNAHVVGENRNVTVVFSDGSSEIGEVASIDERHDLAVLNLSLAQHFNDSKNLPDDIRQSAVNAVFEQRKAGSLDIGDDSDFDDLRLGDKLATIGNPLGFPDVSISKVDHIREEIGKGKGKGDVLMEILVSEPAKEFNNAVFQMYDNTSTRQNKGEGIGGMSGGAVINLDAKGKPKVVGLNTFGYQLEDQPKEEAYKEIYHYPGAISSKDIREFLVKEKYLSEPEVPADQIGVESITPQADISA